VFKTGKLSQSENAEIGFADVKMDIIILTPKFNMNTPKIATLFFLLPECRSQIWEYY